ncbi:phage tail family protein (plasmid) [Fructilactobacillus ixorae]|uniref:Phage tail family protein n=1 Tax=Fructilactobacillus ixorae TaxID=1750535 RepID=A0ABY5C5G0_9LACO|nr:phage tail domain-containing protein [Fructilactobacillus ixorae]USS94010.1 phage tail family protein [Fructilactobacillus ixorae]
MIDGEPEFNVCKQIKQLQYLGTESSPVLTNNYQNFQGNDGSIFTSSQFGQNVMNVHFKLHVKNYYDYQAKRDEIYNLFMQKKIFRLRFPEDANHVVFVRPVGFDINPFQRAGLDCDINIPFENPTGYKFSRYDSLNQSDLWDDYPLGWNVPIITAEDFHFTDQWAFQLLNPSGIPIDPYGEHHDLKIFMKWIGNRITIVNKSNGSSYEYRGQGNMNMPVVLDGCETFFNGQQVSYNSDFGNIKLEPGFNKIQVSGCKHFDISFKFPFIYV